jgi:magnesium chelatase family protein
MDRIIPNFDELPDGRAKRAALIAAAGHHNLLLIGPPGVSKTAIARRLAGILPPGPSGSEPPFRAPHHTVSRTGLLGGRIGGRGPVRPGEVTRADGGALFLDDAPELLRPALEGLREPLAEGLVTIGSSTRTERLPARFLLIACMNPCPCGYRGHPRRACCCSEALAARYAGRLEPIRDWLEIKIEVPALTWADLPLCRHSLPAPKSSEEMREAVLAARARQEERCGPGGTNGRASGSALARIARTIADLEGAALVEERHAVEALVLVARGEGAHAV